MVLRFPSILPSWGRWQREALTVGAWIGDVLQRAGPLRLTSLGTSPSGGGS